MKFNLIAMTSRLLLCLLILVICIQAVNQLGEEKYVKTSCPQFIRPSPATAPIHLSSVKKPVESVAPNRAHCHRSRPSPATSPPHDQGADESTITSRPQMHTTPPSPPAHIRSVRATGDELSTAVEHLQRIARLTTGIFVQMGLIDGKISPDELISELFRLGKVTPAQIIAMDVANINVAIETMKDLPSKLKIDNTLKKAKGKIEAMGEARRLIEGLDVMNWKEKNEFVEEMTSLKNNGLDLKTAEAAFSAVDEWTNYLNELQKRTFDANDKNDVSDAGTYIRNLKKTSVGIQKLINQMATGEKNMYQKIPNATNVLTSVKNSVDVIEIITKTLSDLKIEQEDEDDLKAYTNRLHSLSAASEAAKGIQPSLQLVKALMQSSRSSTKPSLAFSGFPKGFEDIQSIFVDFSDSWMRKVMDTSGMAMSLEALKNILPVFEQVHNALGSDAGQDTRIEKFSRIVDEINLISVDTSTMDAVVDEYVSCGTSFSPTLAPDTTAPAQLFLLAAKLDKEISDVDQKVESFVKILNTENVEKWLKKVANLDVDQSIPVQLTKTVEELKKDKEFNELSKVLQAAEEMKVSQVAKGYRNKIATLADDILKQIVSVDVFQKSLGSYPALLQCLQAIDIHEASSVSSAITVAKKFQSIDLKIILDGESVINRVIKAAPDFMALQKAIGTLKDRTTAESDALRALPDPQKLSETVGAATRAIIGMRALMDSKAQVENVIKGCPLVESHLNIVILGQQDKQHLEELLALKTTLLTLLGKLSNWRTQQIDSESTALHSYSKIFVSAGAIPGTKVDLRKTSESLDTLVGHIKDSSTKSKLKTMLSALNALAVIELDFASFSWAFADSEKSLDALAVFFTSFKIKPTPIPPIAPKLPSPSVQQDPAALVSSKESSLSTKDDPEWSSSFKVFLIFLAVVFGYGFLCCCVIILSATTSMLGWQVLHDNQKDNVEIPKNNMDLKENLVQKEDTHKSKRRDKNTPSDTLKDKKKNNKDDKSASRTLPVQSPAPAGAGADAQVAENDPQAGAHGAQGQRPAEEPAEVIAQHPRGNQQVARVGAEDRRADQQVAGVGAEDRRADQQVARVGAEDRRADQQVARVGAEDRRADQQASRAPGDLAGVANSTACPSLKNTQSISFTEDEEAALSRRRKQEAKQRKRSKEIKEKKDEKKRKNSKNSKSSDNGRGLERKPANI